MATATVDDPKKIATWGPIVAVVNSATEPDKKYNVRQTSDGAFNCNCTAWRFKRTCRHSTIAKLQLEGAAMTGYGAAVSPVPFAPTVRPALVEAQRVTDDISQLLGSRFSADQRLRITEKIRAAIDKFRNVPDEPTPVAVAIEGMSQRSVRYITLED